jgi:anti-repressor protein
MADLQPFDVEGRAWRFGQDDDGTPWAVAADVAKSFDQRDADKITRLLDEDEKGTRIVGTPGGPQSMKVIFEDGIWELIFRSTKPEAKAIKKRVKAILRQIRETGSYGAAPQRELSRKEMARYWYEAEERAEAAEQRAAELEGPAHSWDVLASGKGDYSVADAAKILSRDPAITIGRDRLFQHMAENGWLFRGRADKRWRVYQRQVDLRRLSELPQQYENPDTGELALAAPQVRISVKGLRELHHQLGGVAPLRLHEQLAIGGGA